ncbi:MAG: cupin [Deltaproteobacteria bacterium]|nr:cupin [Deltaproteobacteria bacterium]
MAVLHIPVSGQRLSDQTAVTSYLQGRGICHERWEAPVYFADDAPEEVILEAYGSKLKPFMERAGYVVADVISVHSGTPNVAQLRAKFLGEHTHVEDEVRFFVDGQSLFWFHTEGEVFSVLCERGDLLGIPAHMKHWADIGANPSFKAIRLFVDAAGWVPHYTNSGIDAKYAAGT